MFAFAYIVVFLFVPLAALLLVVLCRMFSHYVSLEMIRSIALVIAVITGKRLLPSVRSRVFSYIASFYARKVALVTLKGLLS